MNLRLTLMFVFAILLGLSRPPDARAAYPSTAVPEKTHQILRFTSPAAEQLSQQLQSLVSPAIQATAGTGTGASAAIQGQSADSSAATTNQDEPVFDTAPTFGTRVLNLTIAVVNVVGEEVEAFITNFSALPQFSTWYAQQQSDQRLHDRWAAIGNDLATIIAPAIIGAALLELLLLPIGRKLRGRKPLDVTGRIAVIGALFLLRAVPIAFFVGVASILLNHGEAQRFPRFVLLNIVYALSLSRIALTLLRGFLAPTVPELRIFHLTTKQARYGYLWMGGFSLLLIYGYFCYEVAHVARVPDSVIAAGANIFGILLVGMTIIVIGQTHNFVSSLLRRNVPTAADDRTPLDTLRLWLARYWQTFAVAYLLIGYAFTALDVQNGFFILLRGTIGSLLIFVAMRLAFTLIASRARNGQTAIHKQVLRIVARLIVWLLAIAGIMAAWGADIPALASTPLGQRISGAVFSVGITILLLVLVYEWISSTIDRHISRKGSDGFHYASSRTRTLLPMLRNTIFLIFACTAILVAFSEAGFNIAPLLAGAGVVGVAIGFGSQTLVKDFLTGLFIVLENTVAVSDVVSIGTHSGVVEGMSMRTLRLRDGDGSLHILAFSETSNIINMTRGFAYAQIKASVAYDTDLEHALEVMRLVGEEMRKTAPFSTYILDPVEVQGVDELGAYAISLIVRLRTLPGKQWDVKRSYLLRMKQRFDAEGIVLPYPTTVRIDPPEPKTEKQA